MKQNTNGKPIIKKTFTLRLSDNNGDTFYRPAIKTFDSFCAKFVQEWGIGAKDIKVHVSSIRPGKKGWKKVKYIEGEAYVNKHKYTLLSWHRELFFEAGQNHGWIKVEAIS